MYTEFIKNVFLKRIVLTLLTVLAMISFSFISYSLIRSNLYVNKGKQELQQLIRKDVFVGNDQSTEEQFQYNFNRKNINATNRKAQSIFTYIDKNYQYSSRWSFNTRLHGSAVSLDTINKNFFNFYPIDIQYGNHFEQSDFIKNGKYIPVIVGPNIKSVAHIGNKFKMFNPATGKYENYIVKGVLQQNTQLPSVYMLDSSRVLNNTIFRPLTKKDIRNINATQLFSSLQDMLIYNSSKKDITKLSNKVKNDNFFSIKFISVKRNINDFYSEYKTRFIQLLIFSVFLLTMFILLLLWNTWKSLVEAKQEIAIRESFGLRKSQIYKAAISYQLGLTMISIIPISVYALVYTHTLGTDSVGTASQLILSSILPKIETTSLTFSFLILLILGVLSTTLIIYKFNKAPITLRMMNNL